MGNVIGKKDGEQAEGEGTPPEAKSPAPAASSEPVCEHARPVTAKAFRKTLRRRFPTLAPKADDSSSDEEGGGEAPGAVEDTKELRCDVCGSTENVWLCMHTGALLCLEDGERHASTHASGECQLMMSCIDSHIYCCGCEKYLYPRELSGQGDAEEALSAQVAAWLQILGRYRNWWRTLPPSQAAKHCHGLPNLGNTCFFSATVQSLMHSHALVDRLVPAAPSPKPKPKPAAKAKGKAKRAKRQQGTCQGGGAREGGAPGAEELKPIHRELRALATLYWEIEASPRGSPAAARFSTQTKALWKAVEEEALFGEYEADSMEDANTLLQDLLCGVDEATASSLFGVGTVHSSKERRRPLFWPPFWTVTEPTPCPLVPLSGFLVSRRRKQRKNEKKRGKNGRDMA